MATTNKPRPANETRAPDYPYRGTEAQRIQNLREWLDVKG